MMTTEKKPMKNVYKKTLAMDLIRMGNDLNHTMRNYKDPRFQVYVFVQTDKLIQDMIYLSDKLWEERGVSASIPHETETNFGQ